MDRTTSSRDQVPPALRIRYKPNRIRAIAATLARRPDSIWVDVLGGGNEICTILVPGRTGWTSHVLLRVFPAAFDWSGGLLTQTELAGLRPDMAAAPTRPVLQPLDHQLITALIERGRASYTDLARRADTTTLTARRRVAPRCVGRFVS